VKHIGQFTFRRQPASRFQLSALKQFLDALDNEFRYPGPINRLHRRNNVLRIAIGHYFLLWGGGLLEHGFLLPRLRSSRKMV
jgi:hypothetical protein